MRQTLLITFILMLLCGISNYGNAQGMRYYQQCRLQSVPDKKTTIQTGKYRNKEAAFADYLINLGYTIRF